MPCSFSDDSADEEQAPALRAALHSPRSWAAKAQQTFHLEQLLQEWPKGIAFWSHAFADDVWRRQGKQGSTEKAEKWKMYEEAKW